MIEIIAAENRTASGGLKRELPKNVRQVGDTRMRRKIYMEDYVVTYLNKLAGPEQADARGAVLMGNLYETEEGEAIFISGAMEAQNVELHMEDTVFNEEIWSQLRKKGEKYFPGQVVMGWFLSRMGFSVEMNQKIMQIHRNNFPENHMILYMLDGLEKEDALYLYENQQMIRQRGYYIYYEKNSAMQEYMMEHQKAAGENGKQYEEEVRYPRIASHRTKNQKKRTKNQMQKNRSSGARLVRAASLFLMLAMGVYIYQRLEQRNILNMDLKTRIIETMGRASSILLKDDGVEEEVVGEKETETTTTEEKVITFEEGTTEAPSTESEEKVETQGQVLKAPIYYVVEKGDTLAAISRKMYMTDKYTKQIAWANGLKNADEIYEGQKIIIPALE